MRKQLKHLFCMLIFACASIPSYGQISGTDGGYLGIWTYVDIHLDTDPVINGYLEYMIPEPPEGVGYFIYAADGTEIYTGKIPVYGPGQPYISQETGGLTLHLRKPELVIMESDGARELDLELLVNKKELILGSGTGTHNPAQYQQCYYVIKLILCL